MKLSIKTVGGANRLIEAAKLVRSLARSHNSFEKRLNAKLKEKGGKHQLRLALIQLTNFALELVHLPCEAEVE